MSYGRHNASSEVAHLIAEIRTMTPEQALDVHGLQILQDKTVYDTAYELPFKNINAWATFVIAQEINEWDDTEADTGRWNDEE